MNSENPMPHRILFVVDGRYPSTGGAEMQVRLLSRAFHAAGNRVEVLVPHLEPERSLREVIDGVPVERIGYPKIKVFGAAFLCLRFAMLLLARRRRYDAIHVHMAKNLAAIAGLVRPLLSATVTTKISGAWEFQGGILDPARRKRPFYRLLNRWVRGADHIQCVSEYTRDMLRLAGYPDNRLAMIPNAVDMSRFRPSGVAPDSVKVVFVGRHVPVKGLDVLLAAWKEIAGLGGARLFLAGDGPERARLVELCRSWGLESSVTFLGNVADVPGLLTSSSIYVQPSYQEGLSNAVLEAMASGLPVVATRISGNEDLIADGESGVLVPSGNSAAIAAALRMLIEQPLTAQRMGRRGREIIESRFSLPAVMDKLMDAYRTAVPR
ncbi:MAG: glycosyltransferase family 4 protein [Rhodocyclales bacterium]|jgi:glycosyltransferase involved in cell wall biosynthesis|nr:glycosyltransferase family 4 protein [Rhodocyclales bacterium]